MKCGFLFSSVGLFLKHRLQYHKKSVCQDCLDGVRTDLDINEYIMRNRNFINIMNQDEIACARAIVTAKDELYKNPLNIESEQELSAYDLHSKAGVPVGSCGLDEMTKFQNVLQDYQIFFIRKTCVHKHFDVLYVGPEADKHIYIYEHDGIFDAIERMTCNMLMWILT